MDWNALFGIANGWAMIGWLILLLAPRTALTRSTIMYLGVGLLCAAYASLMALVMSGTVDPVAPAGAAPLDFTTLDGVMALFDSRGGATIGWIHYLAFDLFTGIWIAQDADSKGVSRWLQAPVLLLTFLAGPIGLLLWLLVREPSARAAARAAGTLNRPR